MRCYKILQVKSSSLMNGFDELWGCRWTFAIPQLHLPMFAIPQLHLPMFGIPQLHLPMFRIPQLHLPHVWDTPFAPPNVQDTPTAHPTCLGYPSIIFPNVWGTPVALPPCLGYPICTSQCLGYPTARPSCSKCPSCTCRVLFQHESVFLYMACWFYSRDWTCIWIISQEKFRILKCLRIMRSWLSLSTHHTAVRRWAAVLHSIVVILV